MILDIGWPSSYSSGFIDPLYPVISNLIDTTKTILNILMSNPFFLTIIYTILFVFVLEIAFFIINLIKKFTFDRKNNPSSSKNSEVE